MKVKSEKTEKSEKIEKNGKSDNGDQVITNYDLSNRRIIVDEVDSEN